VTATATRTACLLGYEVGSGDPVEIPLRHLVVTGQTQEAGKTTALEALVQRSGVKAVAFITKRGEGSFSEARTIAPYFREQADWQFVASILEASRGEKLKFERAWIIRASKGARTLADVQRNVRKAMDDPKTRGMSADVYLTLDAYLDAVVPQIDRVRWATSVSLSAGVNAMDLTALNVEMQHLVIRSTIDWVLNHETDTVVVVPEAWKFIPQGRGTPVKLAAEAYIRQAAGLRNYLWLDSQDIAGVEKMILKSVPVWILGVQRESNEVKRTLDQIPAGIRKPNAADIATLDLGQFYACWGKHSIKTYVQPAWMSSVSAEAIARGEQALVIRPPRAVQPVEDIVNEREAQQLRDENRRLSDRVQELERLLRKDQMVFPPQNTAAGRPDPVSVPLPSPNGHVDEDALYERFRDRLSREAPTLLRVLSIRPALEVTVERRVVEADGSTVKGRVARLLAKGFFREPKTQGETRGELKRTGSDINTGTLSNVFAELVSYGFLTAEGGGRYAEVEGMKVNLVER
jgi:hypothetical protein